MNILFILPEYYPHSGGGIATYYQHYIKALKPQCNKIKVIVGSGYTQADDVFEQDGIIIEYLKPALYEHYLQQFTQYDLLPEFKNNLAAAWAMWQQAEQGTDFDLIEATDFGLGFAPWVIHHTKPVITRLHGSAGQIALHESNTENILVNNLHTQVEVNLLPLCDSLITHSKANQAFWTKILPAPIHQIYPVYYTENEALHYKERENFGLVTARIQRWKGPVELCKAMSALTNPPAIKWLGRDMTYNKQLSTAAYLKENFANVWEKTVIPQPPVANNDAKLLQRKAKFGIVPSTWDMFNFTCLEFLAAGTPVICSNGAGVSELIEHGKNGYKYAADDTTELAECIKTVVALDEQTYNGITQAGIATINTTLSLQVIIPANLAHYQLAIKTFKPTAANVLLNELYAPSATKHTIAEILDGQPIKKVAAYLYERIKTKFIKN